MTQQGEDHFVYVSMRNFSSASDELKFPDFKIFRIRQGTEAAKWKKRFGTKHIPEWMLKRVFRNYVIAPDDNSGFGNISKDLFELLFLFRLFNIGDLFFADNAVKNSRGKYINIYSGDKRSDAKYVFESNMIDHFVRFRSEITGKSGFRNRFFEFSINHFMTGIDGRMNSKSDDKIVDYVIALESLFLIDNNMYFLRSTIAERISRLIEQKAFLKPLKEMYDERSNILHGNNIDLSREDQGKRTEKLNQNLPILEVAIRDAYKKLFEHNFQTKAEIIQFMKSIYDPPSKAIRKMSEATNQANKILQDSWKS